MDLLGSSCIVIGTLSFMVSVLMKNTASSMGIMLAALISGNLLEQVAHSWPALKYSAFTHLRLTDYLAGEPSLIPGMSLPFSLTVLSVWAIVSLVIAFVTFTVKMCLPKKNVHLHWKSGLFF